jgi:putative Mg2+ transporter-C (MgtC) family protein
VLLLTLAAAFPTPDWWDACLRLAVAALLGGLVGAEREQDAQIAGLRTHAVLAIGAALTMLVSLTVAATAPAPPADPGRIAAQVVSGIGFLGAGAIIRLGTTVRGLTTAGSLWTVAAIGLAVGAGYFIPAAFATLLLILVLHVVDRVEARLGFGRRYVTLHCEAPGHPRLQAPVTEALRNRGVDVRVLSVREDREPERVRYEFRLRVPEMVSMETILADLREVGPLVATRIE